MEDARATTQAAGLDSLPRTAQGWIPITLFDKDWFHEGQDFLVQLSGPKPLPLICSAQWMVDEEDGPLIFTGDWRYVDELRHLQPVAFQPMPKPSDWADLMRPIIAVGLDVNGLPLYGWKSDELIGTPLSELSGRPGRAGFDKFSEIASTWGY